MVYKDVILIRKHPRNAKTYKNGSDILCMLMQYELHDKLLHQRPTYVIEQAMMIIITSNNRVDNPASMMYHLVVSDRPASENVT